MERDIEIKSTVPQQEPAMERLDRAINMQNELIDALDKKLVAVSTPTPAKGAPDTEYGPMHIHGVIERLVFNNQKLDHLLNDLVI